MPFPVIAAQTVPAEPALFQAVPPAKPGHGNSFRHGCVSGKPIRPTNRVIDAQQPAAYVVLPDNS
jgi:hypothetical protein